MNTTRFFKGVGVGTFLHLLDVMNNGIQPADPHAADSEANAREHVARGPAWSPYVSVTRSYAIAEGYAKDFSKAAPTPGNPAFVYVFKIPDPIGHGYAIYDPNAYVASHNGNPLKSPSYHHDGDKRFLLGVNLIGHAPILTVPAARPMGMGGPIAGSVSLTQELIAMVFSLRDAEALIYGGVPQAWVRKRLPIF